MSEFHPPTGAPPPPVPGYIVTPPRPRTPPLGLSLVSGGLGPVFAAVIGAALYAGPLGDSTSGWAVFGVAGLAVAAAVGFVAVDAYLQNTGVQWWHLLTISFAVGMIANALYGGTELILGAALRAFVTLAGLIALVVGGIIASSQIRRTGESGRGMALAGLILGYLYVVFWIVVLVVAAGA